MRGVVCVEFEFDAARVNSRMNPAVGLGVFEGVGAGWEVDEVNAGFLGFDFPGMSVAEEDRLRVFAWAEDFDEGFGVFQSERVER